MSATSTTTRALEVHLSGTSKDTDVGTITHLRADGFVVEFTAPKAPVLLPGQPVRFRVCNAGLGGLANGFDARGTIESREQRGSALLYGIEIADTAGFARALYGLTDQTDERRTHKRVPFESGDSAAAIIHHGKAAVWLRATIIDVSESGIGVICSETFSTSFRQGDPIKLTFRLPGRGSPITMAGTVRGRIALDRRVRFGIEFDAPSTATDLTGMRVIAEYVARHLRMMRGIT
jgi:hypothetical protein